MKTISKGTFTARNLRKKQTDGERRIWRRLKNNQFEGLKFRRQQPIGGYIVDFVNYEKMLVIEIDGGQHNEDKSRLYDKTRTEYLKKLGYSVLRFWNNEVDENLDGVFEKIRSAIPSL